MNDLWENLFWAILALTIISLIALYELSPTK
jgi:hypothetical protein